jgi:hypothetical protein
MEIDQQLLEKILMDVEKPIRYVGGEWNAIIKRHDDVDVKVLLAFPDTYEIGMSHLGLRILYSILNRGTKPPQGSWYSHRARSV